MNFSENLRRLRKAKDIKQEALAEAMNVSRQTVSKWENGTAMPDFKKLNALAEYFGVTMDELLGFSNDKNNNDNINDYTKEYINELITLENMQSSEKIKELYKKLKTCAVIFCVALADDNHAQPVTTAPKRKYITYLVSGMSRLGKVLRVASN